MVSGTPRDSNEDIANDIASEGTMIGQKRPHQAIRIKKVLDNKDEFYISQVYKLHSALRLAVKALEQFDPIDCAEDKPDEECPKCLFDKLLAKLKPLIGDKP